ncbi:hypothetical protein SUGI_0784000 [Cryptomeria japonica]|uniref:uncharacterized protein LOC131038978 n=1 Tax=Cryptomeria japonica TaxID=3369 RepID=UPI0024147187|nr:uncharacterized protein LOC131038978 [Cryptomeria japonica]GLJ38477.1 hypothetical protein SUGI_0784000 [Cryptomeria japonica]
MMGPQYPMRWESTGEQWWFATPVDWAAANGFFEVVKELLRLDGNLLIKLTSLRRIRRLETVWEDDNEASFRDAAKGRGLVARELMGECETKYGNILIDGGYGGWLLYSAAAAGDITFVRYLLKREPFLVFGEGEYGVSDMLYAAARSKNAEIFREILGLANDIKCLRKSKAEDSAAVMFAAPSSSSSLSFQMLNRGIHAAARGGNVEILRELLKHCPDVSSYRDNRGSTALHSAASRGQAEVTEELLLVSPDIIAFTDDKGNTPLHIAAYRGHLGIVKQLLSSFPSLLTAKNNDGNTVLHLAVAGFRASGFRRLNKQMNIVRHLVSDKTIDLASIINCKNKEGRTAMHLAVLGKVIHKGLVELLMSAPGLNINVCDKHGMSAVDILELNLVSGITSDPLLKQLALAGGKPMRSEDSSVSEANISYGKLNCPDNSPGTSFRSSDSSICTQIEDSEIVDASVKELTERNAGTKYFIGNQKKFSTASHAKQRLATLLGWSQGGKISKKGGQIQELKQDITENRSKSSAERGMSAHFMHDKEWPLDGFENPFTLRERFSKTSILGNKSDSFLRKTPSSPFTKHRFPKLCGNDFNGAVSPGITPFASPSRSSSLSPIRSPLQIPTRFKDLMQNNGSIQRPSKSSAKDGAEDNGSLDSYSRSLEAARNQYFCFGFRALPTENLKSKDIPGPLDINDSCQVRHSLS